MVEKKKRTRKETNLTFPVLQKLFANKYLIDNFGLMPEDIDLDVIHKFESCHERISRGCEVSEDAFYELIINDCTGNKVGRPRKVT